MNPKLMRRLVNRAVVARKALEANRSDVPPFHKQRLEDCISLVQVHEDELNRELGNAPSAARRREQ